MTSDVFYKATRLEQEPFVTSGWMDDMPKEKPNFCLAETYWGFHICLQDRGHEGEHCCGVGHCEEHWRQTTEIRLGYPYR